MGGRPPFFSTNQIRYKKMRKTICLWGCLLFALLATGRVQAQDSLRLAACLGDHMVLQRDTPACLWGWAPAGARVQLRMGALTMETQASEQGRWQCWLPAHPAGGPHRIALQAAGQSLQLDDVLFGDVWLASGQSNMEWTVGMKVQDMEREVAQADHPQIRYYKAPKVYAPQPREQAPPSAWRVVSPATVSDCSAVGYFFARRLQQDTGVPVGIVDASWGGTPIEAWMSAPLLQAFPQVQLPHLDAATWEQTAAQNEENARRQWALVCDERTGAEKGWGAEKTSAEGWQALRLPNEKPLQGAVWLRRWVELPAAGAAVLRLSDQVGSLHAQVYVNGRRLCSLQGGDAAFAAPIALPAGMLRKGRNLIALRLADSWADAVRIGQGPFELWLQGQRHALQGEWQYRQEAPLPSFVRYANTPTMLFNGMLAPLRPLRLKGFLWYQGESNAGRYAEYAELLRSMVLDWRVHWQQGHLPFLSVQLASYMPSGPEPEDTAWARLREAQQLGLRLPHAHLVTAIDVGDPANVHPRNKQEVGRRLALMALQEVYGYAAAAPVPQVQQVRFLPGEARLRISHLEGWQPSQSLGFALAGADRRFYWAALERQGEEWVLRAPEVPMPVALRYGWGNSPRLGVQNAQGWPLLPFRTDDWPLGGAQ